ncbi:MAG: polysaccharide deacetylase family protein [Firmicutes bacterium]|nr:polysaccharide deacetylase family protein [Bacillota bacterium]
MKKLLNLIKLSGGIVLLAFLTARFLAGSAGLTAYAFGEHALEPSDVSAAQREKREVPIIMYHNITKNQSQLGKYAISPKEMENDLIYLRNNGYETVLMQDLIDYVNGEGELPEKPIVLTFDDGNSGDYNYLLPLLKKYDMKAVCSIIGKITDDYTKEGGASKPHLDWEQVREMQKDGRIEIQNHSYNMHGYNGSGKLQSESADTYRARLRADLEKTQAKIKDVTGFTPTTFVYPLGVIGNGSLEVLKGLGFRASLSCWEGINTVTKGDADGLFKMRRAIRRSGQPVSDVLSDAYLRMKRERANSVRG